MVSNFHENGPRSVCQTYLRDSLIRVVKFWYSDYKAMCFRILLRLHYEYGTLPAGPQGKVPLHLVVHAHFKVSWLADHWLAL
jgi:hypothetical protein